MISVTQFDFQKPCGLFQLISTVTSDTVILFRFFKALELLKSYIHIERRHVLELIFPDSYTLVDIVQMNSRICS